MNDIYCVVVILEVPKLFYELSNDEIEKMQRY